MESLYSERRTWLHAVPAAVKLLVLAVAGTVLFLFDAPVILCSGAALSFTLFLTLGRSALAARRLWLPLLVAAALVAAFHALMGQAQLGALSALRLLATSLLGIMLTLSTRADELLHVFEVLLSPLQRCGVRTDRFALQIALVLRFTEHFFVRWKRLDDAYRLRTGRAGGFRILAPLTIQMLLAARRVADALTVRLGE